MLAVMHHYPTILLTGKPGASPEMAPRTLGPSLHVSFLTVCAAESAHDGQYVYKPGELCLQRGEYTHEPALMGRLTLGSMVRYVLTSKSMVVFEVW